MEPAQKLQECKTLQVRVEASTLHIEGKLELQEQLKKARFFFGEGWVREMEGVGGWVGESERWCCVCAVVEPARNVVQDV